MSVSPPGMETPVRPEVPQQPRDPKAEAAAKAYAKAQRPWYKMKRFIIPAGFVVLVIAGSAVPSEEKSSSSSDTETASQTKNAADTPAATAKPVATAKPAADTPAATAKPAAAAAPDDCGTKATDDCTPHVNLGGSVRVDALDWKVTNVKTAAQIGDQQYGLGEKANGRFVIVSLSVHSNKDESATLSGNSFQLEVGGNKYDTDSDGTVASIGSGDEPFFLEDIGPDADVTGKVVFDLPESVLSKKVEMRFNELGFGSTHGYIDITPQLG